jgi:hypothetical protein
MITETIANIEKKLSQDPAIPEEKRRELIELLTTLKTEVGDLAATHTEHAESISHFARASAHEATRKEKDPQLLELSLNGLNSSVKGFEVSHPKLVEIVNRISQMLSNMGI